MSYTTNCYNVMIASPGDVASERSIIRDVIYEWNAVHSYSRKIVLLPVGWESHSTPEMGAAPQTIINHQILERCDLLIGVFWTRVGTATEKYASGTVEEVERHIESGKPTMLYFSAQPVALDTVDLGQIANLKVFKESCQSRGLYESYDSHSDFRDKFYRQLQIKVNEHPIFKLTENQLISDVRELKTQLPILSDEARMLLKAASKDPHGVILYVRFIGGTAIQTNGNNVIPSNERREIARWEQALEDLNNKGLIVARGQKGEMYEISNFGYQVADMIEL